MNSEGVASPPAGYSNKNSNNKKKKKKKRGGRCSARFLFLSPQTPYKEASAEEERAPAMERQLLSREGWSFQIL